MRSESPHTAAAGIPLRFDGLPADADWDNLLMHFRAEIQARRDPQSPPVQDQPPVRDGVGSQ